MIFVAHGSMDLGIHWTGLGNSSTGVYGKSRDVLKDAFVPMEGLYTIN